MRVPVRIASSQSYLRSRAFCEETPELAGATTKMTRAGHLLRLCDDLQVTDFKHGTVWKLLIASYETLRKFAGELAGTCDMLVRASTSSLSSCIACQITLQLLCVTFYNVESGCQCIH